MTGWSSLTWPESAWSDSNALLPAAFLAVLVFFVACETSPLTAQVRFQKSAISQVGFRCPDVTLLLKHCVGWKGSTQQQRWVHPAPVPSESPWPLHPRIAWGVVFCCCLYWCYLSIYSLYCYMDAPQPCIACVLVSSLSLNFLFPKVPTGADQNDTLDRPKMLHCFPVPWSMVKLTKLRLQFIGGNRYFVRCNVALLWLSSHWSPVCCVAWRENIDSTH